MGIKALLSLLLAASVLVEGGDDGHNVAWEWAGIFTTPEKFYTWTAQSVEVKSSEIETFANADPGMKIVLLSAINNEEETLHALEEEAEHAFQENCTDVHGGGTLNPAEHVCYQLHFDASVWQALFKINATDITHLAVFAQQFPTEFKRDARYLKDDHGHDIGPVHTIPEDEEESRDKPWGAAIGAAILVMVCTLIGDIFITPIFASLAKSHFEYVSVLSNAFAAGALLATAFYLLLYEVVREEEAFTTAEWGSMVLTGFITACVFDLVINSMIGIKPGSSQRVALSAIVKPVPPQAPLTLPSPPPSPPPEVETVKGVVPFDSSRRTRVLAGVLLGDVMHNFVDGFFIGAAFAGCDKAVAWTITASTIYHELAQEISDYLVLTNPQQGNLKPPTALLLNFISGWSVLLGVVIITSTNVSNYQQGMLLAFGGGVYVQIGATECMTRVHEYAKTNTLRALSIAFFVFGALAIGLVLLDHEHCSGGGGDGGGHDGHDHRHR